ncbi:hypothetical protein HYH02_005255 [Chlamydomonas schloesseri]|uniref:LisH domain-containing protein n=1 Tax=Chlamydomonas schloesseri TaxID=2026947 RepID=A0A835WL53_9CHLO|nr:hypothetical protein HYH02_005255 [Chlamydomonas schloesseri]|eukprot:KAG2449728.1 hypothetical protein HYH02_005255 [Chlamydomonas schloesseri]
MAMEGGRAASGLLVLPRGPGGPLVDVAAVRELINTIANGGFSAQLSAAAQLAEQLEMEEGRFRDVVGDPWSAPAGQRAAAAVGKLLNCVKERESVYDTVCDSWILSRTAALEQQVAGLRLVLACLSAWSFQYPLTEDRCMELLLEWAGEDGDDTPTPSDPAPADDDALLREARSVYATGLLAIAMTNEDYSGQASSSPLVPRIAKYLRRAMLEQPAPPPPQPPQQQQQQQLPSEAGAAAAAAGAAAASTASRLPCHPLPALRRLRLQYCAALLGAVGEYLDALGPVLAERGVEALLELLRRGAGMAPGPGTAAAAAAAATSAGAGVVGTEGRNSGGGGGAAGAAAGGAAAGGAVGAPPPDYRLLYDALGACVALTAHRRFSEQLVEAGGVELLLAMPRNPHTYSGLAMMLYSLAAAPLAFERLLAAGHAAAAVGAALGLLGCGQDGARKTAVSFLSSVMTFPAALREFQAQDGLRRMVNLLRALLTSLRAASLPPDLRMERQVGYYAALTLRMFVATHLTLHVAALRRGLALAAIGGGGGGAGAGVMRTGAANSGAALTATASAAIAAAPAGGPVEQAAGSVAGTAAAVLPSGGGASGTAGAEFRLSPYRAVDTSREALDALGAVLESDRRLAEAFCRCRWPALEALLDAGCPALLLALVADLPPERWFHEAAQASLEALRLLSLAPLARRAVVAASVPGPGGAGAGGRSGVGVLLNASILSTSAFFTSDPEVVSEALAVLTNLVTPPPSLLPLLPSSATRGGGGGGGAGAGMPGGGGGGATPARRPDRTPAEPAAPGVGGGGGGGLQAEGGVALSLDEDSSGGDTGAATHSAPQHHHHHHSHHHHHNSNHDSSNQDHASAAAVAAAAATAHAPPALPPPLDLGPAAPSLGSALEAGYVAARQAVRAANGIRSLMQLLQPRHGVGPAALPAAALERIRSLACRCLVGLAGDPAIRQILTRLQLARLLSDLVRDPLQGGGGRRPGGGHHLHLEPGAGGGGLGLGGGGGLGRGGLPADWHSSFTAVALELIALTTTGTAPAVRHGDKLTAAANDAAAPALHKIERAAIAAASAVSYSPQELLLLIFEHLKASGLHASAASLAAEAGLGRASAALQRLLYLQPPQLGSAVGGGGGAGAGAGAGAVAPLLAPANAGAAGAVTPFAGGAAAGLVKGGTEAAAVAGVTTDAPATATTAALCTTDPEPASATAAGASASAAAGAATPFGFGRAAGSAFGASGTASAVATPGIGPGCAAPGSSAAGGTASALRSGHRPIAISAALRDAAAVRSRSDLALDLARLAKLRAPQPQLHLEPQSQPQPSSSLKPQAHAAAASPVAVAVAAAAPAGKADGSDTDAPGRKARGSKGQLQQQQQHAGLKAGGKQKAAEAAAPVPPPASTAAAASGLKRRASAPLPPVPHPSTRSNKSTTPAAAAAAAAPEAANGALGAPGKPPVPDGVTLERRRRGGGGGAGGASTATPLTAAAARTPGQLHKHKQPAAAEQADATDKDAKERRRGQQEKQERHARNDTHRPARQQALAAAGAGALSDGGTGGSASPPAPASAFAALASCASPDAPATAAAHGAAANGNGGGAGAGGAGAGTGSDSEYLARAFGASSHRAGAGHAAVSPQVGSRAKAWLSPFAAAAPAAGGASAAAGTAAAGVGPGASGITANGPNALLLGLPSRKPAAATAATAVAALKRHSSASTASAAAEAAAAASGGAAAAAAAAPAAELPAHVEAAARELQALSRPPVLSKLHAVVMSYLRQQHRQAVMSSAVPTACLPAIPLAKPYVMPQATRALDAPYNVTKRLYRRELLGGHGGRGGARADTQLIYSRFRPLRTFRDDGALTLCAAFMQGWRRLVVGSASGDLKLHDPLEGSEALDLLPEAHDSAVVSLRVYDGPAGFGSAGAGDGWGRSGGRGAGAAAASQQPLLLSCSRNDVKLWVGLGPGAAEEGGGGRGHGRRGGAGGGGDGGGEGEEGGMLPRAPKATWTGVTKARFHPDGTQVVAVSATSPRQALLFDVRTAARVAALEPPPLLTSPRGHPAAAAGVGAAAALGGRTPASLAGIGAGALGLGGEPQVPQPPLQQQRPRSRGGAGSLAAAAACYSPTGQLLLWGNALYDLRSGAPVHQFDQFTDGGAGAFHPAGLEVILNSEVWDLRTFRLLRSVPSLDGASVLFNGGGDVLYAARRQSDEPFSALFHPRRARHPLHTAFRSLDAGTYADIATVPLERVVLDMAVEPSDSLLAVVCVDLAEEQLTSAARVFEVGRRRPADDDSDADDDDDDDDSDGGSEDDDEEMEYEGASDEYDTPAPTRPPRRDGGGGRGGRAGRAQGGGARLGEAAAAALGLAASDGDEEDEDEDEEHIAVLGRPSDDDGEDEDDDDDEDLQDEDEDDDDRMGDGTDDEEIGMAMLEDAYAELEEAYGGEGDYDLDIDPDELDDMDDEDEDEEEDEAEDDEDGAGSLGGGSGGSDEGEGGGMSSGSGDEEEDESNSQSD